MDQRKSKVTEENGVDEQKQAIDVTNEQRMEKIEMLLSEQTVHNKKMLRSSHTHTVIMPVFVAVIIIGLFVLNTTLVEATRELPAMLKSITALTDTATVTVGELGKIDFDVLNESIKSLETIIRPLAKIVGAFG
ncbi:MAG: hypothetical protein RR234_08060 [Christensenella sp.]